MTREKVGRVRTCRLGPRRPEDETAWITRYYRQVLEARLDQLGEFLARTKGDECLAAEPGFEPPTQALAVCALDHGLPYEVEALLAGWKAGSLTDQSDQAWKSARSGCAGRPWPTAAPWR